MVKRWLKNLTGTRLVSQDLCLNTRVSFFFAQTGRLSVEEAMSFAESTGLTSSVKDQEEMTYNFGVYKHTKDRSRTERYILQFDFNEQALSTIQKGKFGKKIPFDEIRDYDSEVS